MRTIDYADRFRRAWGPRADPFRDAGALARVSFTRVAGIARTRDLDVAMVGAARRNSSPPVVRDSSSRIDCSPRFTAVSRSRAF